MGNINIFKQSNLFGRWWGNIQTVAQHTNIYIQFMILGFSAVSAYGWISASLHQWGINMPFWLFAILVILGIVLMSLFAWSLTIPSTFATWNYQWWNNENPLRKKLEKRDKEIDQQYTILLQEIAKLKKIIEESKSANTRVY